MNLLTETITPLLADALVSLLSLALMWLISWAVKKLKAEAEAEDATRLEVVIYNLVVAAEQVLKKDDPTGHLRKQYVIDLLQQLGYEVNKEVLAQIEAAVWAVNVEGRHE